MNWYAQWYGVSVEHGTNGDEKRIGLRQVRVDGYIPSSDSVIEFQVCQLSLD